MGQKWFIRIGLAAGLLVALAVALLPDEPARLPGVALGATELLRLERGLTFLAAWLLLMIVVVRGWAGELPDEISGRGLKYSARELQASTREALDALVDETERQREAIVRLEARLDLVEGQE
jgi:hypothetical protein